MRKEKIIKVIKVKAETFSPNYHKKLVENICENIPPKSPQTPSCMEINDFEENSQFHLYEERKVDYSGAFMDYFNFNNKNEEQSKNTNKKRKREKAKYPSFDGGRRMKSSNEKNNEANEVYAIKLEEEINNKNQMNVKVNDNLINLNKNEVSKVTKEEKNEYNKILSNPDQTPDDKLNHYNTPNSLSLAEKRSNLFGKVSGDMETKALTNEPNKIIYLNKIEDKLNDDKKNGRIKSENEKQNNISDNNTEIITEKNFKEKDSPKSSETKKRDIIKIKFITTKNPKFDSTFKI